MYFYRNKFMLSTLFIAIFSSNVFAYVLCEDIVTAAWKGDYNEVKSLIKQGANPNCEYKNKSALFAASRYGRQFRWDENIKIVQLLVKYGANIDYISIQNNVPLSSAYIAALYHHIETSLYLVDNGAKLQDAEQGYIDRLKEEKNSAAAIEFLGSLAANAFGANKENDVSNNYKKFKDVYLKEMSNFADKEVALGKKYYENKNYEKAMFWYKAATKWNSMEAKYYLANMYFYGTGIEKKYNQALNLLKDTPYINGIFIKGAIYSKLGNYENSALYFKEAANYNDKNSQYMLGLMYISGKRYLPKNIELAYAWLTIASENGLEVANKHINKDLYYPKEEKIKEIVNSLKKNINNKK